MASRVAFGSKQGCYVGVALLETCFAALRCRRELLGRPLPPRFPRDSCASCAFVFW